MNTKEKFGGTFSDLLYRGVDTEDTTRLKNAHVLVTVGCCPRQADYIVLFINVDSFLQLTVSIIGNHNAFSLNHAHF